MTSFIFLADGFEEIEALTVVDVMRRAGMEARTVSISNSKLVRGSNGVIVEADTMFNDADFTNAEWLVCPGGMPGAENLHKFSALGELLKLHSTHPGKVAAICAAPAVVLAPLGLLRDITATCYPGFEGQLTKGGAEYVNQRVVTDGNIITANGPSSALLFALAIVASSKGEDAARAVAEGMLLYPGNTPYYF